MAKYPKPLPIPKSVKKARQSRNFAVLRSARFGIGIRLFVILFELVGVAVISSSSLFMDAISHLIDVVSTIFLILCMKLAQRPPDSDHPFGHGRYEPLGGLAIGLLLSATGAATLFSQTFGFSLEAPHAPLSPYGWLFPFIAMICLEFSFRWIIRTAKAENSPALEAEAYHYRIDGLTSLFATLALLFGAFFPQWSILIDHAGAIFIALFMIVIGVYASRNNLHQLMDRVPEQEFFEKVEQAAKQVKGVKGTEKIRIQSYGPDAHVDIDIEVEPQLSVDLAHRISQEVRTEIQKAWPAVRDVTVHIEPYYANDH